MARGTRDQLYEGLRGLRAPETRSRPRLVKVAVAGLVVLAMLFAGAAGLVFLHVQNKFKETHDASLRVDPLPPGEPMNVLVLGSDRRNVIEGEARNLRQYRGGGGQRADTIILVHLSGDRKRAVLMHFPRDLRVRIPGRSGHDKINAAYAYGGPNLVMQTLRRFAGIKIHHYVEVNFASFRNIVNSVGGVNMCVDRSYDDPKSGLKIPRPGCYQFDGDKALSFARARFVDPDGDFGRIRRQQRLIRSLMQKVKSIGFLANIPRVIKLSDAIAKGVVTDNELTLGLVRQIASRLAGFQQRSVDFRVVPSFTQTIGGVSYVIARESEARAIFAALNQDAVQLPPFGKTPLSIPDPSDVTIRVLNGTTVKGLARKVADDLARRGFVVRGVRTAEKPVEKTRILFRPGEDLKVELLKALFPGADVQESVEEQLSADVVVVVGPDLAERYATPSPSAA
jgi:LCP family protein required for cell wall assembly